jgi:hypothetical protein
LAALTTVGIWTYDSSFVRGAICTADLIALKSLGNALLDDVKNPPDIRLLTIYTHIAPVITKSMMSNCGEKERQINITLTSK